MMMTHFGYICYVHHWSWQLTYKLQALILNDTPFWHLRTCCSGFRMIGKVYSTPLLCVWNRWCFANLQHAHTCIYVYNINIYIYISTYIYLHTCTIKYNILFAICMQSWLYLICSTNDHICMRALLQVCQNHWRHVSLCGIDASWSSGCKKKQATQTHKNQQKNAICGWDSQQKWGELLISANLSSFHQLCNGFSQYMSTPRLLQKSGYG